MIAALYVDSRRSPYAAMNVDLWPIERDARRYNGPGPCIAHPPCGPHGKYRSKSGQDFSLAEIALCQVRRFGGVLEHPEGSQLAEQLIADQLDLWEGFAIRTDQYRFGFDALKPTILYFVRPLRQLTLPPPRPGRPKPYENLAATRRHLTPPTLAAWLVDHFR